MRSKTQVRSVYRPISPHLQIYRLPLNALLSISHRFTGLILSLGVIFFLYVLYALARGPDHFGTVQTMVGSWPGRALLGVLIYALMFHLCTGIRHLVWDAGRGLEPETARHTGWVAVGASLILTGLVWILALWLSVGDP